MQVFQTTANPNNFKFNGLTYPKNFMCIKQGDSNVAIHNAYDTRLQLLGSTHYSQFQVDGVTPSSQANLMAVLSTLIFSKQFNYITQTNGGNQLISIGSITVDGNYITIEPAEWNINGLTYQTTMNTIITVPFAATDKNRIDLIVATDTNELIRIEGDETSGIAVAPIVPLNTIYVTQIAVNDNSIGEPDEPVLSDLYIPKDEKTVSRFVFASPTTLTNFGLKKNTIFIFENNLTAVHSFSILSGLEQHLYDGKEYIFINKQSTDVTFYHNSGSGTGTYLIDNLDNANFILKPNQVARYIYHKFTNTFRRLNPINESDYVHTFGNESIDGIKTFIDETYFNSQALFKDNDNGLYTKIYAGDGSLEVDYDSDKIMRVEKDIFSIFNSTGYDASFISTPLTANRTYDLPNKSGTIALLSDISGSTGTSELEKVTESGKTGWRLLGQDPANYGNIGNKAVDLNTVTFANSTYGTTGDYAFSVGHNNVASGEGSVAMCNGTKAVNYGAFAAGTVTTANGYVSSVFGEYNTANSYAETVLGHFASNITGTTNSIVSNEPVFRIGIGTDNTNRSDGFRVYNNGSSYFKPIATSGITGSAGYFAYNSANNLMAFHNGSAWNDLATKNYADTKIAKHTGSTYTTNAIQTLTQAEYNAISGSTNANTIYFII